VSAFIRHLSHAEVIGWAVALVAVADIAALRGGALADRVAVWARRHRPFTALLLAAVLYTHPTTITGGHA